MRKFLLAIIALLTSVSFSQAQNTKGTVKGRIYSSDGQPASFVAIGVKGSEKGVQTDEGGYYEFTLPEGKYTLQVQFIGHEPEEEEVEIKGGESVSLPDFKLKESAKELQEVEVVGKTELEETQQQAYNVSTIDAQKLHNSTLDLAHALDKVSGIRVREAGGVGSNINFSLNGFTGRQVKFFIDGIPMDNLGSSFQINNIPVSLAERIEVYKGVVPLSLGMDALGGAINIITNRHRNYLEASYSYGSFNTHRTSINTAFTAKSGFTAQLNVFQNYSDNNYKVYVPIVKDLQSGYTENGWARRFHDTYHNETIIANIGVVDKKYADRLLIGMTLGNNEADIQTGNRMYDVYGERRRSGNTIMPSIKYAKRDLFFKGLDVSLNGNYNLGQEQTIDTVYKMYNWLGQSIYKGTDPTKRMPGGERGYTLYKYRNNNGLLNGNISYHLSAKHSFVLNGMLSTFNRTGKDELAPEDENFKQPRKTQKTILGLGYRFNASARWNTTVFVKEYFQQNTSFQVLDKVYYRQQSGSQHTGYGIASTYFLATALQLKSSFEKSYRLPENEELFGDVGNIDPNFNLKPESSYNFNLGLSYKPVVRKVHQLYFEGNFIYRYAEDFIRQVVTTIGTAQLRSSNLRGVINKGLDGEIRYSYKKHFSTGVNVTYQDIRNNTKYEGTSTTVSPVYRDRIPNMPFLFGNANASLSFYNVGKEGTTLSIGYNVLYVHAFYLRWPSQGDGSIAKYQVPTQWAHDANIVYSWANGKYNIALEGRNLADQILYDNFSLQKPSRSFSVKFRCFISNSPKHKNQNK